MKLMRSHISPFDLGRAGLLAAAFGLLLAPLSAQAQSVTLSFVNSEQSVTPGSSVTYSGTIINNSNVTEFLNGFDFGGLGPDFGGVGLTADATAFFNLTPLQLTAGQSTGVISLFTVAAAPGVPLGSYPNIFNIEGGTDTGTSDILGGAPFIVDVVKAPVPEASTTVSLSLLLLGGVVVAFRSRRGSCRASSAA